MSEKAPGIKKQQQQQQQQQHKNNKGKHPEKKKNQENGVKHQKRSWLIPPNVDEFYRKKKSKGNKNNVSNKNNVRNNHNYNKSSKKKSGQNGGSFFWVFFTRLSIVFLFLGFIYIVDYEKFVRMRDWASYYVNKTASLLPPEVLTKGKQAAELIQPVAEVTFNKANGFVKEASNFLNTNPIVKDHWTNIREISSICSERLVDYMLTVYVQATGYCNDFKSKIFN